MLTMRERLAAVGDMMAAGMEGDEIVRELVARGDDEGLARDAVMRARHHQRYAGYSDCDLFALRALYLLLPCDVVAPIMGRTPESIYRRVMRISRAQPGGPRARRWGAGLCPRCGGAMVVRVPTVLDARPDIGRGSAAWSMRCGQCGYERAYGIWWHEAPYGSKH